MRKLPGSISAIVAKHPALIYFATAFAISWGGMLLTIGGSEQMRGTTPGSDPRFVLALLAMLAGPSVAGFLLTGLVHGRAGIRQLLLRLRARPVGLKWYAGALLTAPLLMMATLCVLSLVSPAFLPGIFISDDKTAILLAGLAVGIFAGVFEEVGWTGFAIPTFRRTHSVFTTGLTVGILWSAWHLPPTIWSMRAAAGELSASAYLAATAAGVFVGYLTAFRLLMVWVYEHTDSLLLGILMHVSFTSSLLILNPLGISGIHLLVYNFALAFTIWSAVAIVALTARKESPRQPGSIAEIKYLPLGGIDQWVMIRGGKLSNPPLIVLHGGPGMSDTSFFRSCNAELEQSFTMVYWDQRGTCKSFDAGIPKSSMTAEQFLRDLDELVDYVRHRLGHQKVGILGHSWGSVLGVLYAAKYPEKVSAYVGCAQIGDSVAAETASYAFAVAEAQRRNNPKAVEELRAIGPPPYGAGSLWTERMWIQRLEGQMSPKALWKMGRILLGAPEASFLDIPKAIRGFRFTLDAMYEEVSRVNLITLVPALQMPVFFFVGDRDRWVPPETSLDYFQTLAAPSKKLFWFERSGHEAFVDEPDRFNTTMVEVVRPALMAPIMSGSNRPAAA